MMAVLMMAVFDGGFEGGGGHEDGGKHNDGEENNRLWLM